jgi:hypothetical protein
MDIEQLEKAAHYWKDKDPAKYKKMLAELRNKRKTPGHKERAYQQVTQAKRRERGGSGTTTGGHSSGNMKSNTGKAVKQYMNKEGKQKSKLSMDRKNNEKGYEGGNVRYVPQDLNRGSHKIPKEKLDKWKSKVKKSDISIEEFAEKIEKAIFEKTGLKLDGKRLLEIESK